MVQQEGDVKRCKTWSEGGPKIRVASVSLAHCSRDKVSAYDTKDEPGLQVKVNIVDCYVRRRRVVADSAVQVVQQEGDVERCETWPEGGPKISVASISLAHCSRDKMRGYDTLFFLANALVLGVKNSEFSNIYNLLFMGWK